MTAAVLAVGEVQVEIGVGRRTSHTSLRHRVVEGSGRCAVLDARIDLELVAVVSGIVGHVVGDKVADMRTGYVGQHALVIYTAEVIPGRAVVDYHIAEFGCGVEDIARGADCTD